MKKNEILPNINKFKFKKNFFNPTFLPEMINTRYPIFFEPIKKGNKLESLGKSLKIVNYSKYEMENKGDLKVLISKDLYSRTNKVSNTFYNDINVNKLFKSTKLKNSCIFNNSKLPFHIKNELVPNIRDSIKSENDKKEKIILIKSNSSSNLNSIKEIREKEIRTLANFKNTIFPLSVQNKKSNIKIIKSENNKIINYTSLKEINKKIDNVNHTKLCDICNKNIELFKYKFHHNLHPSKVFNWVYLGSYKNACDLDELRELGIDYVLNCAIECYDNLPEDINYCHIMLNDYPSFQLGPYLEKATKFINKAKLNNGKILIHCQLGISRSTSMLIAYMIKYLGYTTINALNYIQKKRPQVMPNFGFIRQLCNYEKKCQIQ